MFKEIQYPKLVFSIIILIISGISNILFGVGFLKLKDKYGKITKPTAILNIISGISFVTVVLAAIGSIISILTGIFQVIIMFRASKSK